MYPPLNLYKPITHSLKLQGYPQRMRLQRRLYGMYTISNLIFVIHCNLIQPWNRYIFGALVVVFTVLSFVSNPIYLSNNI